MDGDAHPRGTGRRGGRTRPSPPRNLFTVSPVGLFLLDPRLRLIRFNPAGEGMQGSSVDEAVGKRPTEAWPGFPAETVERVMEQVLTTGEPVIGVEKYMRPPGDPDHDHVYSANVFRLQDDEGRILGIADATIDVTDRHLAQERLKVLAEVDRLVRLPWTRRNAER
ncbi:PAS domain-containing protein [Streptomyces sp. NPDC052721]|uniref:PAS domain-containing protein n=1 Tax=Streptomyces sp. NPDC052721 TaxID=3154955 RepID=UPI003445909D